MLNGSHSTGPSWGDVTPEHKVKELIHQAIKPLKKRIEIIEKKLGEISRKRVL